MPYYKIGYTTNFTGCDDEIIVYSEEDITYAQADEWARDQVQLDSFIEELDEEELDEDDIDLVEEW